MKKLIAAFILILALPACAQEQHSKANGFYRDGKFEEAIPLYKELSEKNPENPYLCYNLGNAYFKTNRLGRAVASYYKAFELLPRDSDIRYNLSLALKRSGETLVPPGVPEIAHRLYYLCSDSELTGIFWIFLWLASLAGIAALFAKTLRGTTVKIAVIAAAIAAGAGSWRIARAASAGGHLAVTVDGIAEVRSGPGDNFTAAATVPEGHTLEILDDKDGWYEVGIRSEGIKGWVKKTSLEIL